MLRIGEHLFDRPLLDDLAGVHHAHRVGDATDDAEIVGDEQHAHPEPRANVGEQRQDLRLHGDVERRGRLVGDQQIRLVGERHRDHHALPLPAGQLMRIAGETCLRLGNADLRQQLDDPRPRLGAAHAAVQLQDLADLRLDRVQRIERGHRLLKHDRDLVATNAADLALGHPEQFASLEPDLAGRMRRARIRQQLQDRQRADRLARAGLAHQRNAFAPLDPERHMIDGRRRPAGLMEGDRQVADIKQRLVDRVHQTSSLS